MLEFSPMRAGSEIGENFPDEIFYIYAMAFCLLYFLIDIDECDEGTSGCTHNCMNIIGSYICSCDLGYRLESDRQTCYGKLILQKRNP